MDKFNRDELYLICKILNRKSILNFSSCNKSLRHKIILHDQILKGTGIIDVVRISLQTVAKYGKNCFIPLPSKTEIFEKGGSFCATDVLLRSIINLYFLEN